MLPDDTVHGIEVKSSRDLRGWQGHNAEDAWLMVFYFESGRPTDVAKGDQPPHHHAGINRSSYDTMVGNWIYKTPGLKL